tara:strand:+ start:131 stop:439 length:309 start_codon:yes stop_codon:yes gene_type:complete
MKYFTGNLSTGTREILKFVLSQKLVERAKATVNAWGAVNMVATFRRRAGFTVSNKSEEQMKKEDIRNRQACSMRYRREVKVSIQQAPWEGKEDEQRKSRKSR